MVARPGRLQAAFNSGELTPVLWERTEIKYFSTGAAFMQNVRPLPQGGFTLRDGLRDVGAVDAAAARIRPFDASDGASYDLVFSPLSCQAWDKISAVQTFAVGVTEAMLPTFTDAQQLDTMILFHNDLKPQRIKLTDAGFVVDDAPLLELPNYDYGGYVNGDPYTNAVPAVWQLEFVGLSSGSSTDPDRFTLVANGETSSTIGYDDDMSVLATAVAAALSSVSTITNVSVAPKAGTTDTLRIQFDPVSGSTTSLTGRQFRLVDSGGSFNVSTWTDIGAVPVAKQGEYDAGPPVVSAIYDIEFLGFLGAEASGGSVFDLTISNQPTSSLSYTSDMAALAAIIQSAIVSLPNVAAGVTVADAGGKKVNITFSGSGNEGDDWAVSGNVINKADAAILASKTTQGVAPGEPIISADRGYPACGLFYTQRLLLGGLKSRPNIWMFSKEGNYYNFDERFTEANGPAVIPMDVAGGEKIVAMAQNRYLLIFTTQAEYWISDRALAKTSAPNHVQASRNGSAPGVAPVENEGAALYVHQNRSVLGEFRYTDVEGNFVSADISLLGAHLMHDVVDQALQRSTTSTSGNLLSFIRSSDGDDGTAGLVTILREQDVTSFSRNVTNGQFKATAVNGRNETSFLVERPDVRRLERFETDLLLDAALTVTLAPAAKTVTGLARFNGQSVWAIGDGNVYGPYTVASGQIVLPVACSSVTVGYWTPPIVATLPLPRTIGPHIVLKRRARIHSAQISVIDTSSLAVSVNGGVPRDVDLKRYGDVEPDVPELDQLVTGTIKVRGLTGWADDPQLTITQLRPGRLTVRSITLEATL